MSGEEITQFLAENNENTNQQVHIENQSKAERTSAEQTVTAHTEGASRRAAVLRSFPYNFQDTWVITMNWISLMFILRICL